jgi:spore maturation protein CgeB
VHILLITSTSVRTSDAAFLLAKAFERKGHRVTILSVDMGLPPLADVGYRSWGFEDPVYRTVYQRHARKTAAAARPDAVLLYGSNWSLEPETLRFLRYKLGAQTGLWEVNHLFLTGSQARCLPLYDHVFCLDSYYVPVMRANGLRCVEHLCAAADPDEHRPLDLSADERTRYQADVSFIGTHHRDRAKMLGGLAEVARTVKIYGHKWEEAGPPVANWVSDESVYGRKKTVIYNASRLSFHLRGTHMLNGENFRVYEVAACGGVPLARSAPDLLRSFEPGSEVVLFETAEDLRSTVGHYLQRPEVLSSIAAAARSRVLGEHTYDHRAAVILDHFENCGHSG